jgi:hypothetical protein
MNARKQEIRKITLDILLGREKTTYESTQFAHLKSGVAEVMARRSSTSPGRLPLTGYPELSEQDALLLQEVFWDLFLDRIITIGLNPENPDFPWFRLHSEAAASGKL